MIYINNSDFKNPKRMFRKLVNKWEFASIISPQTPKANNISCLYNNEYSLIKTHRKTKTMPKINYTWK
jgi:hypothetical protein